MDEFQMTFLCLLFLEPMRVFWQKYQENSKKTENKL